MSIRHAILGILSYKPQSGYGLKKVLQESAFMHWSGNNNQIYNTLVELSNSGFVKGEILNGEGPLKKVYTITGEGLEELKRWTRTLAEMPEMRKPFLVQLAWSGELSLDELKSLIDSYEAEIEGKLLNEKGRLKKGRYAPDRNPREAVIWKLVYENVINYYEGELMWVNFAREKLKPFFEGGEHEEEGGEEESLGSKIVEKDGKRYVLLESEGPKIRSDRDAIDLISACSDCDTKLLLIPGERLCEDFFKVWTGIAVTLVQKLSGYKIKFALVIDPSRIKGSFKDFLDESESRGAFRSFQTFEDAEKWLVG